MGEGAVSVRQDARHGQVEVDIDAGRSGDQNLSVSLKRDAVSLVLIEHVDSKLSVGAERRV
jgi:hypothetical protein